MNKHYTKDSIRQILVLNNIYKEMFESEEMPVSMRKEDEEKINNLLSHINSCEKCRNLYEEELKEFFDVSCSSCSGCNGCRSS